MHANHREEIDMVYSGDIAAAVGLKDTTTGDTLCDEKAPIILESMVFPDPVISVAVEPKTKADQEKMGIALKNWQKKIRLSVFILIRKQHKPSFLAWASCIWTLLLTVCCVNSK